METKCGTQSKAHHISHSPSLFLCTTGQQKRWESNLFSGPLLRIRPSCCHAMTGRERSLISLWGHPFCSKFSNPLLADSGMGTVMAKESPRACWHKKVELYTSNLYEKQGDHVGLMQLKNLALTQKHKGHRNDCGCQSSSLGCHDDLVEEARRSRQTGV